jgi:hypothetical protein
MTCHFGLTVINRSGHEVHLREMTFPALMPGNGNSGAMIIGRQQGFDEKPRGHEDNLDATFNVDESVASGESTDVQFTLTANPRACLSAGTAYLDGMPRTGISVLHRHITIDGDFSIRVRVTKPVKSAGC